MIRFRIKNFGPVSHIQTGDGFLEVRKFSFFIGPQGSGKSSVLKLLSTFMWLEKALVRKDVTVRKAAAGFVRRHCGYFGIDKYFHADTELIFQGSCAEFVYRSGKLEVKLKNDKYILPKLMYIPAERNFLSVFPGSRMLKNLPFSLADFLVEFDNARQAVKSPVQLPLAGVSFEYDALNKVSWIVRDNNKTRLEHSASGFQSALPMLLVSGNLSDLLFRPKNHSVQERSLDEIQRIRKELEKLLHHSADDELIKSTVEQLRMKYAASCFVNLVEEPEQNLYPASQTAVLFDLIRYANKVPENLLLVTTHSPYMINSLTLAVKAYMLKKLRPGKFSERIAEIVPEEAFVNPEDYVVYQLNDAGAISPLAQYEQLPSDENLLNAALGQFNSDFDTLLEIEDED